MFLGMVSVWTCRRLLSIAALGVGLIAALCLVPDTPASAATSFNYSCYTYVQTGAYQADRAANGTWSAGTITSHASTYGAPSSYYNDVCAIDYSFVVEAGSYMRGITGSTLDLYYCGAGYTSYQYGAAYATATCADNYTWTGMRIDMGHRAWFAGTPYDQYTVAGMTPY